MHGSKCPVSLGVGFGGNVDSNLDRDGNDMLVVYFGNSISGYWTGVATIGKTWLRYIRNRIRTSRPIRPLPTQVLLPKM